MRRSTLCGLMLATSAGLGAQDRDARIAKAAEALRPRLVETRRDFHRHPELSNQEERTSRIVAERLRALGLEVKTGVGKFGVVALLKGGKPGPVVAYRADMDALPITEVHEVPYKSQNVGVMHACGHDAHTTVGLGIAEVLAGMKAELHGTVKFIFQPAEEGAPGNEEGGAALMIKEGVMENPKIDAIFGLHTNAGLPVGTMSLKAGPMLASVDTWVLTVRGKMAHGGAAPHQGIDAVLVSAECIEALQTIRSRRIDPLQPMVLSVGTIHGGIRDNIIAEEVRMEGTLRTLDPDVRARAKGLMKEILDGVTAAHGARYELSYRANTAYPVTVNDAALVTATLPTLARVLGPQLVPGPTVMGAEDFSFFQERAPGAYLWLGVANPAKGFTSGAHTAVFDLDEEALVVGVRTMCSVLADNLEHRP